MLKKIAIVAGLGLALAATAEAQTPRKGGTIRMTAPYGSSFTSLDIHTTQRAQDEIFAKGLHRSLYIWDSAEGKPVPELAKEVIVVGVGDRLELWDKGAWGEHRSTLLSGVAEVTARVDEAA